MVTQIMVEKMSISVKAGRVVVETASWLSTEEKTEIKRQSRRERKKTNEMTEEGRRFREREIKENARA